MSQKWRVWARRDSSSDRNTARKGRVRSPAGSYVLSCGWSWPSRLLARGSTWLHLGGAQRGVPGTTRTHEAEGVTIATVIRSTTKRGSSGTHQRTRRGRWIEKWSGRHDDHTAAVVTSVQPARGTTAKGANAEARARPQRAGASQRQA
jgi:hypothetical protein